jgi:alkylation response protein AidB-like acyl-CoA dehydrogenase
VPAAQTLLKLPGLDDPRRRAVRDWFEAHPAPSGRDLAEAGYVAPHWPKPWGLEADPIHQLIIDDELRRAGVGRPANPIAIGWAGPTILYGGNEQQKERYLFPMLSGEEIWCQLFSEPGAGSDLANLSTRAVRDGDDYVINGQKVWTTLAHFSKLGILLARTDPDAPKHLGISYFLCPMDAPGIEVRGIREMTGATMFNEVFFDDARIPAANLVGEEGRGWEFAKVTLANERVSLSGEGALWGRGPTAGDLVEIARTRGGVSDATLRQRLADVYIEGELLQIIRMRTLMAKLRGEQPGPEASVRKALADDHGQHVMELARDLAGTNALLEEAAPMGAEPGEWNYGFLYARALTIGGGTSEVQRNIIAERVLGLPHDVDVEKGKSWAAARTAARAN